MKITTEIVKTETGHKVGFSIGSQTFFLQEREIFKSDEMDSLQFAKWYEAQLLRAFEKMGDIKNKFEFKETNTVLEVNPSGFVLWKVDKKGFKTWILDALLIDRYKKAAIVPKVDKNGNFKID